MDESFLGLPGSPDFLDQGNKSRKAKEDKEAKRAKEAKEAKKQKAEEQRKLLRQMIRENQAKARKRHLKPKQTVPAPAAPTGCRAARCGSRRSHWC